MGSVAVSAVGGAGAGSMGGSIQDRLLSIAEELGRLKWELVGKLAALGHGEGDTPMSLAEAAEQSEEDMPRDWFMRLMDYWSLAERVRVKEEAMGVIREEARRSQERWSAEPGERGGGRGKGGWPRELSYKMFSHMREARFSGKEGGTGWGCFLEDVMVALGSVDRKLEAAVRDVVDLRGVGKEWNTRSRVEEGVDAEVWRQYSGGLYARLLELTRDEAQKLVRNEGLGGRCGFWALRRLVERYSPRTFTKRLRMLMGVLKPPEVKHIREVQAAVEDWEARVRRLEEEYQDRLDDSLRVAVLVSFLPESLQEKVFELEKGGSEVKFEAAKEVVVATAVRKAEQRKPRECETMAVGVESGVSDWDGDGGGRWGDECELDAVGMGKGSPAVRCHRCGGMGHFARECATPWDMGGAQKGGGKTGGKKGGFGGKGEGKSKGKG